MARGRPKKSDDEKIIRGTFRPAREAAREAKRAAVASKPVQPPTFLSNHAKTEWRRISKELHEQGNLSKLDRAAMAALCEAWAKWRTGHEILAEQADSDPVYRGLIIKTALGNEIQNPVIGIINKAAADIVKISGEFGLTPASRSRVSSEGDDGEEKDPAAQYFD